ncbi:hypothetical protein HG530_013331 [Fusarium avenaceum]|nr:hypothetical protein HG530_013331 [Fusarium avenaceum]
MIAAGGIIEAAAKSVHGERGTVIKHISSKTFILALLEPSSCLLFSCALTLLLLRRSLHGKTYTDILNCLADLATSADKHLGAIVPQIEDVGSVVVDTVLDVLAALRLVRGTGVCATHIHGAHLLPARELLGVEIVDFWVSAAEEEKSRGECSAGGEHGGALLDEAAEGSEAGSSSDADDGGLLGVAGEVEGGAGSTDRDV